MGAPLPNLEELRLTLLDFAAWYKTYWLVARYTRSGQGRPERQGGTWPHE